MSTCTARAARCAIVVVMCAASLAQAAARSAPAKSAPAGLAAQIAGLAEQFESSAHASVGLCVVQVADGKKLADFNSDTKLTPASNQKIVTSAVAMAVLGGDYKFTTSLYQAGKDLLVVGDYDPTLGDPYLAAAAGVDIYAELDRWAAKVKESLSGRLDGDVLVLDPPGSTRRHEDWPKAQASNWYAAPVCPLNFNNNCYDVTIKTGKAGVTAIVSPQSSYISVKNRLTAGGKHIWSLKSGPDEATLTLSGTTSGSSTQPTCVAMEDPPMVVGRTLADRIVRAGVDFRGTIGRAEKYDASQVKLLASTVTPMATVMARANKRSLNMAAESIFLRACGSWTAGPNKAAEVLVKTYGLSEDSFTIHDGGGLSKYDRVSPAAMVKLLTGILQRKDAAVFVRSLPICGTDGTMEKRLTKEPYKGRVLGKTGYIAGVSCLSGYVLDKAGSPAIAFSVMVNKINGPGDAKHLEDGVCQLLVDHVDSASR